jgi:hypothetical protein
MVFQRKSPQCNKNAVLSLKKEPRKIFGLIKKEQAMKKRAILLRKRCAN